MSAQPGLSNRMVPGTSPSSQRGHGTRTRKNWETTGQVKAGPLRKGSSLIGPCTRPLPGSHGTGNVGGVPDVSRDPRPFRPRGITLCHTKPLRLWLRWVMGSGSHRRGHKKGSCEHVPCTQPRGRTERDVSSFCGLARGPREHQNLQPRESSNHGSSRCPTVRV